MKALLDFIPLLVFLYLAKTQDVLVATQGLIIATVAVVALQLIQQKGKLMRSQWIVLALTLVFGGLTLAFHDDTYIRWKSPVVDTVFAIAFLLSPLFGGITLAQRLFQQIFNLSAPQWKRVNFSIAAYFLILAVLHYLFAFWPSLTPYWVDFKTIGSTVLNLAAIGLLFFSLRRSIRPELMQKDN